MLAKVTAEARLSANFFFERELSIIKLFLVEAAIELGSAQKWRESSRARQGSGQGAKLCGAGDSLVNAYMTRKTALFAAEKPMRGKRADLLEFQALSQCVARS